METLPVLFRTERDDGSVTAVFPTEPGTNDSGTFTVYAHLGQHSSGSWEWYQTTRKAMPDEYAPLLAELRSIYEQGDDAVTLRVMSRMTAAHHEARRKALRRSQSA